MVTPNIIDKLAIQFTCHEMGLQSKLTMTISIDEAIQKVKSLYTESNGSQGFAMVILDLA